MAEIVGLLAGSATLLECVVVVGKLANAFKDHQQRLERLKQTLNGVYLSSGIINQHIESWDINAQRSLKAKQKLPAHLHDLHLPEDGNIENLLITCSDNLESLVARLEKEILRLEGTKKQEKGILPLLSKFFRTTRSTVQIYIRADQLEELISATKSMEASLGIALTGLLIHHYKVQSIQHEVFSEELREHFNHQTETFEQLNQRLNDYRDPTVNWEKVPPKSRKTRKSKSRQKESRKPRPCDKGEEISENLPATPTFAEGDGMSGKQITMLHHSQNSSEHDQAENASGASVSLTTMEDGASLDGSENIEALLMTLNNDLDGRFPPLPALPALPAPVSYYLEGPLDLEAPASPPSIESPPSSTFNDESEAWDSDFADHRSEIDSYEVNVQSKARIFIDIDTKLSICFRPDLGVWKFCTRSLLLPSNGEATFVLQNPCEVRCEHISIQTKSVAGLSEQDLPQTVEASLCSVSAGMAPSTATHDTQDRPPLSFTVESGSYTNHLYTSIFLEEGGTKWVTGKSELFFVADAPYSRLEDDGDEIRKVSDEDQNLEQAVEVAVERNEDEEVPSQPDQRRALAPFSSIPCLFCFQDALNPRLSGGGQAGFLIASNRSFRITCARCNDHTWISAMTWGLSLPVGGWTIG